MHLRKSAKPRALPQTLKRCVYLALMNNDRALWLFFVTFVSSLALFTANLAYANTEQGNAALKVVSAPGLDPEPGNGFLVLVEFNLGAIPQAGKKQLLVSKYHAKENPYPGWAMSLNNFGTSIRPEIYWRGKNGSGGAFTFDRIEVKTDRWYSLILRVSDGAVMQVFLIPREYSSTDPESIATETVVQALYLGGYDVRSVRIPQTNADLVFRGTDDGERKFPSQVRRLLIARASDLPQTPDEFRAALIRDTADLRELLRSEEIELQIEPDGRDHSSKQHQVEPLA